MSRSRRGRRARAPRTTAPIEAAPAVAQTEPAAPETVAPGGPDQVTDSAPLPLAWLERWFVPAAIGILLVAAALRLPELGLNPFHHDEGVNGWFTSNLVRSGTYTYDPNNYHGPSLYYLALASEIVFGLTDTAMRLVPALFGLALIAIVLSLRSVLGTVAVLVAAGLLAISPGMVYVSRYFIHEMLLVAGTAGFVGSVLLYLRTGRPFLAITAAVALAVMATTKESWIIELGVLGIAAVAAVVYVNLRTGRPPIGSPAAATTRTSKSAKKPRTIWVDGVEYRATDQPADTAPIVLAGRSIQLELLLAAAIVFVCIYILLFSSLFTNFPRGVTDSLAAFANWAETGGETQIQPIYQYLAWMFAADGPILVLGTVGGLIAAIRGRDRLWVFIGLWALGITLAYSIPSYKTPWIVVNMLLPLALLGGYAIREIATMRGPVRFVAPLALVVAFGWSAYQAIDLNYRHYDDEIYPYVFVHSTRELFDLLDEIEARSEQLGTGRDTGVTIVSPDYWPLPWYLRDYPRAGFFGQIVDTEEPLIIANQNQDAELAPKLADRYTRTGSYVLRPGVVLDLYVRSDLAGTAP